jgi:hypothetical protein
MGYEWASFVFLGPLRAILFLVLALALAVFFASLPTHKLYFDPFPKQQSQSTHHE